MVADSCPTISNYTILYITHFGKPNSIVDVAGHRLLCEAGSDIYFSAINASAYVMQSLSSFVAEGVHERACLNALQLAARSQLITKC